MATLKDVAQQAGVSVSTASYVLNGKKKVRWDTEQKILRAATEVGYIPNQAARGLRIGRSHTVGIIIPDITNVFFPDIVRGVEDILHVENYNAILCNSDNNSDKEYQYVNTLVSKDIDGIIFIGTAKSRDVLEIASRKPVVLVDRIIEDRYSSVTAKNYIGGFLATEHLIRCGYRRIALFSGPLYAAPFQDRLRGHQDALRKYGIPEDPDLLFECDNTDIYHGYHTTVALLQSSLKADSIFAANDLLAFGALRVLWKAGISVPEEFGIVGYDDIMQAALGTPALTTIHQPKYEMGQEAARLLLQQIRNQDCTCQHITLEPTLVVRETTRALEET